YPCAAIARSATSRGEWRKPSVDAPSGIFGANSPCAISTGLLLADEDDLPGFRSREPLVCLRRIVEIEAMRQELPHLETLPIDVDQAVIVVVDEVPDAVGHDLFLEELRPRTDRRLASCSGEDHAALLAHGVER